jgi:hypothetical protein
VADFLGQAAGHAVSEDDEALACAIYAETEGNPFFVSEVLRHLIETGGVKQENGRWVTTQPIETLGIPEGVRDVVGQRLSRLSESANEALSLAAVVGTEFELALLEQAGSVGGEDLLSVLDEVVAAHLVAEVPGLPVRARLLAGLGRELVYGDRDRRVRLSDEALAIARRAGDDPTLAEFSSGASTPLLRRRRPPSGGPERLLSWPGLPASPTPSSSSR